MPIFTPLTTPFLASKLAQESLTAGVQGFTGGLGQMLAARQVFDKDDARQLAGMQQQQQRGEGASQAQRSDIRSQYTQARGGQARTQEARQSDQAASMAAAGMLSGRELFEQEMAAQKADLEMRQEEARAIRAANEEARQARAMQIQEAEARRRQSDIMRRQARTQMLLSTALGFALPATERLINQRRAERAKQAADTALGGMTNPTPAMSTSVGNYGGVFGRSAPAPVAAAAPSTSGSYVQVPDFVRQMATTGRQ